MNLDVRNEWVTALRSGKYAQTTGILQDANGYCCLGVLCAVAEGHGIKIPTDEGYYASNDPDALMPKAMYEWADINKLSSYGDDNFLYRDNDQNGCDFNAIADIIEREF